MDTFGDLLRKYRKRCRDPLHGGSLSQVRLGELIGDEIGDMGYSGAAVSFWEGNKSKIAADDRFVLVSLISVLHSCGGLSTVVEANELLRAGNYRDLDDTELRQAFPETSLQQLSSRDTVFQEEDLTRASKRLSARERRKQLLLLQKVHSFWVKGVLNSAIKGTVLLNLVYEHCDDLVSLPWSDVIVTPSPANSETSNLDSILETYMAANRALLIVGEPGSGKTISMLVLADELIHRARINPTTPIPVILNLGSWAEGHSSLKNWIVAELTSKYQIPRSTGLQWLDQDELVLMLDGFDEVPERFITECVRAINEFRQIRGLTGIVVCSRSEEYERTGLRMMLGDAIGIRPLDMNQVYEFIRVAGKDGSVISKAIDNDPVLNEIARTPLMLKVMLRGYKDAREDSNDFTAMEDPEDVQDNDSLQRNLIGAYAQRMFQSRRQEEPYNQDQTELWLGWFAQQMFRYNTPQLLIDQIQPNWLADRTWRRYYMLLAGLITGIAGAVIMWLLLQLIRLSDSNLPTPYLNEISRLLRISQGSAEILPLLLINLLLGLLVALLQGSYFERLKHLDAESSSYSWRYEKHLASVALLVGLTSAFVVIIAGLPKLALIWSVSETVIYVTMVRYVYGRSYSNEIRTVEALAWSWRHAAKGLIAGSVLALIAEVIEMTLYRKTLHLESEYVLVLAGLVLGGIHGRKINEISRLYQGIFLSFRNSFWAALISTVVVGTFAYLIKGPAYGFLVAAIVFITSGALLGGNNVIKHLLVRGLLWLHGDLPWRLGKFLDYATSLAFLRKVGGSYIFSHRLLQEYFASLSSPATKPKRLWFIDTRGLRRNFARRRND